jgi:hypothetical protein
LKNENKKKVKEENEVKGIVDQAEVSMNRSNRAQLLLRKNEKN